VALGKGKDRLLRLLEVSPLFINVASWQLEASRSMCTKKSCDKNYLELIKLV